MYEVYALKYGERDTTACQFFYREASHEPITLHFYVWPQMLAAFDTIHALAGSEKLIVAGHDPEVAGRFTVVQPGVVRIA